MKSAETQKMQSSFNLDLYTSIHDTENNPSVFSNFHKNFEILVVLEGSCDCSISGQTYRASKGEIIFICPFQLHSFNVSEGSSVRRVTFHHHLILTISQAIGGKIPRSPIFRPREDILKLFLDFIDEAFGKDSGIISRIQPFEKRIQTKGILYLLGGEFLKTAELIQAPKTDALIMDIIQYIAENFKKNISLKDIAKEKGYNYQYVSRVFNNVMDANFKKMVNYFRLEYAYALLQDTDMTISQICFESGFGSVRSFNEICKSEFGKTPKELRSSIAIN